MATATATHARSHPPSAGAPPHAHPVPRPPDPPPNSSSPPSLYAAEVERDEAWVRQLQEEQHQRFSLQASVMYKEHLAELESAGPFATHETREALQARYDERLKQMRDMQQEELEQHIERERQERLWSLGLEDERWEGWNNFLQDQAAIYANIKRAAGVGAEPNLQDRIRENAREAEDVGRHDEEWQNTDYQRVVDRARWAERQRLTNMNVGQRRQRDRAEAESQAAQARARDAHLRETLGSASESAPSSRPDSVFSAAASSIDTPPSSLHSERWRPTPSPSIAIPTHTDEARRSFNADRASPVDDLRHASPARPSPLSGTPTTSHTMAYAKTEERPTVWIPPEGTRGPGRKGSIFFDGREPVRKPSGGFETREPSRKSSGVFDAREPARKTSGVFDAPEPVRKASGQFGPQEDPSRRTYQSSPSPQPQLYQPPNAPSLRSAPLPSAQPMYTPSPQPIPQQPQPQPYQPPPQSARPPPPQSRSSVPPPPAPSHSRPSAPPPTTQPPPRTTPPAQPTSSQTNTRPAPPTTTARPTPAPAARPVPAPTPSRPAPAPTRPKGPPPPATDPAEERRRQLREEFVGSQRKREEDERRRRDEEENERRAEEARRRGAEKRRAEEEARAAERRESERKEAERRMRAGLPKASPAKAVDMAEVWAAYESHWAAMASAAQLRFRSIPWPVPTPVLEPASLYPVQIAAFVLSPAHSQGKSRKDRLREALLRWHPDRFEAKWLRKVVEEEREIVKEGVGLVVRALNELLSAEGTFAA